MIGTQKHLFSNDEKHKKNIWIHTNYSGKKFAFGTKFTLLKCFLKANKFSSQILFFCWFFLSATGLLMRTLLLLLKKEIKKKNLHSCGLTEGDFPSAVLLFSLKKMLKKKKYFFFFFSTKCI